MSLFYDPQARKPTIISYIVIGLAPVIVIAAFWYYGNTQKSKIKTKTPDAEPDIFQKK